MKASLLRDSVELLNELRTELHDSMDDNAIEKIDEIIQNLKAYEQTPEKIEIQDLLNLLGTVLEYLPIIVELIEIISSFK